MPRSKTFSEAIKKTYWSTGDIGRELKIKISRVTFWCKEFHVEPKRSGCNWRQFTEEDRNLIHEIYFLLVEEGLHIWAAKKKLEGYIEV